MVNLSSLKSRPAISWVGLAARGNPLEISIAFLNPQGVGGGRLGGPRQAKRLWGKGIVVTSVLQDFSESVFWAGFCWV